MTKKLTQDVNLTSLLPNIIKSIMMKVGAQNSYILFNEANNLKLYAHGKKANDVIVKLQNNIEKTDCKYLSMAIVRYVQRTKKMLVIENASKNSHFISDPTVSSESLKSIFCLPLINNKKVIGVLYLENNLIASIFKKEDIELTKLLMAQAAIALENVFLLEEVTRSHDEIKKMNIGLEDTIKRRTKELAYTNTELSDFAYSVSHDLKAPLRGITQLSAWLAEDYTDNLDDDGIDIVKLLEKRSKQMYDMIEGLLQYSRAGRVNELSSDVDINLLVKDVAQYIAIPDSITLEITNKLPTVHKEETLMFQIFQNLLDNAVKYMDKDNGVITVSSRDLDDKWELCVADNGVGIAPKYQAKVFQIFQMLKPKDETDSTGVGLSLLKKITHNWGGDIWIKSKENEGCQFYFTIPKC